MTNPVDPSLRTDDFDYDLPQELIAQEPLPHRGDSRLLVLNRASGEITHTRFEAIDRYLRPGEVVVANNSKVIAARLDIERPVTGGKGELLLLRKGDSGTWEALARPARRLKPGERVTIVPPNEHVRLVAEGAEIVAKGEEGTVTVRLAKEVEEHLDRYGRMPLPPYISRSLDDPSRYQTAYASEPGSAAAPTAGLHFSQKLIERLIASGVIWAEVTLHIGLDTFRPVSVERVSDHKMHSEWCTVPDGAAEIIATARRDGRRVIALGTTAARTLETAGLRWESEPAAGLSTDTSIFITPGYQWRIVDAMITNFHLPRSTLLMMISAFAGRELVLRAYEEAIERKYRFYSLGDAMLIV